MAVGETGSHMPALPEEAYMPAVGVYRPPAPVLVQRPEVLPPDLELRLLLPLSPSDPLRILRRSVHYLPTERHSCRRMPYLISPLNQIYFGLFRSGQPLPRHENFCIFGGPC